MKSEAKRQLSGRALLGVLLLVGAILPVIAAGSLPRGTLTYQEIEGEDIATHVIAIVFNGEGHQIDLTTNRGSAVIRQTFLVEAGLATREWTFSDPERKMDLAASVQGDQIVLEGSFQGKGVNKRFAAKGASWNQLFQMGLGPFVLSGDKSMGFRSIGTQGPGELKIGKMSVTRKGEETIEIAGKLEPAVHLRISLSGLLSIFWHGDYWYRKRDGLFLRYRGKNRKGGPIAVSELIEERL